MWRPLDRTDGLERLQQVFEAVISASNITVQDPMFMEEGEGAQFWKKEFGAKTIMGDCKRFISSLKSAVGMLPSHALSPFIV